MPRRNPYACFSCCCCCSPVEHVQPISRASATSTSPLRMKMRARASQRGREKVRAAERERAGGRNRTRVRHVPRHATVRSFSLSLSLSLSLFLFSPRVCLALTFAPCCAFEDTRRRYCRRARDDWTVLLLDACSGYIYIYIYVCICVELMVFCWFLRFSGADPGILPGGFLGIRGTVIDGWNWRIV